ncbi:MAG: preprotein translocase subunit Sec61beta [Candidatus Micrarchaeia archaeon]|jgi:preprotein translocase subunit Sec61beta
MAEDRASGPQSAAGIVQFVNDSLGGPKMDPKAVLVFSVVLIFLIKIVSLLQGGA